MDMLPELKNHDDMDNFIAISQLGIVYPSLLLIDQGAADQQRVGRTVYIMDVAFKLRLELPSVNGSLNAPFPDQVRIILLLDKNPTGGPVLFSDFMQPDPGFGTSPLNFTKIDREARYKILWDKTFSVNRLSISKGGNPINWYSPRVLMNIEDELTCELEVNYPQGSNFPIKNNITLAAVSLDNIISVHFSFRIKYFDTCFGKLKEFCLFIGV